jgi:hypothetical protein
MFGEPQSLPDTSSVIWDPRVALDGASHLLVAWSNTPFTTDPDGGVAYQYADTQVYSHNLSRVAPALPLDPGAAAAAATDVVFDAQGNAIAVWLRRSTAAATSFDVVSRISPPGLRSVAMSQTLSTSNTLYSLPFVLPRLALGETGGAIFAAWHEWQQAVSDGPVVLQTRGALRVTENFATTHTLGVDGDLPSWMEPSSNTVPMNTPDALRYNELRQPSFDVAVGPNDEGFMAVASFNNKTMPMTRKLWLQRARSEQEPSKPLEVWSDGVPNRPSPPAVAINAQGDGALVWDTQTSAGTYVVMTSLLN